MDNRNESRQRAGIYSSQPQSNHIPMTLRSDPRLTILPSQPDNCMIRLDQPRPHVDRYRNEYVDSPATVKQPDHQKNHHPSSRYGDDDAAAHGHHAPASKGKANHAEENKLRSFASDKISKSAFDTDHFLTKQPHSVLLEEDLMRLKRKSPICAIHGHKQLLPEKTTWISGAESKKKTGIICPECGRCRCAACITPKELPSYWLCNGNVECSAESLVDQVSCMSCVKGFMYHCTNWSTDDMDKTVDSPCSCYGKHCCSRWALMGILSVTCLPCLLCYWPCRGVAALCAHCYAKYHQRGCTCRSSITASEPSKTSSTNSSPVIPPRSRPSPPPPLPPRPGHPRRVVGDDFDGRVHR